MSDPVNDPVDGEKHVRAPGATIVRVDVEPRSPEGLTRPEQIDQARRARSQRGEEDREQTVRRQMDAMGPLSPPVEIDLAEIDLAEAHRIGDAIAELASRTPPAALAAVLDVIKARLADCERGAVAREGPA